MAGDIGTVAGPVAVGFLVDSVSYNAAFFLAACVLGLAALAGLFAQETRRPDGERIAIPESVLAQLEEPVPSQSVAQSASPAG